MPYTWTVFTDYLDGTREIKETERDELWDALAWLLAQCGGRWRLKSADMDAIKASHANTDLTSLEDTGEDPADPVIGDLAKVLIDIDDTFSGLSGYDAFYAVAPDEGLNDTQLAVLINGDGRVTLAATFHVWNLYKRVLSALTCCPTTLPALTHDTVGRTLSKFGFPGWVDTNKRYLRVDYSGALLWSYHGPGSCGSPGALYARDKYAISGHSEIDEDGICDAQGRLLGTNDLTGTTFQDCNFGCNPAGPYIGFGFCEILGASIGGPSPTDSFTQTTYTRTGTGCAIVGGVSPVFLSGVMTAALDPASEYTDADLIANVRADIADEGFDGDYNDTAGAYRNLSADGLSYSERRYDDGTGPRQPLPEGLINGVTYRIRYLIRFTDLDSVSTDGDETYHEFTFSTGQTYVDMPHVDVPEENGTNYLIVLGILCPPFAE